MHKIYTMARNFCHRMGKITSWCTFVHLPVANWIVTFFAQSFEKMCHNTSLFPMRPPLKLHTQHFLPFMSFLAGESNFLWEMCVCFLPQQHELRQLQKHDAKFAWDSFSRVHAVKRHPLFQTNQAKLEQYGRKQSFVALLHEREILNPEGLLIIM